MNNRIGFKLISLIVAMIFCLQGCIWKTISVDEQMRELSRKPAEIGREYKIVLASQSSVRVYEEVKTGNKVKYEVIDLKRKGRATGATMVGNIIAFPIMIAITFGIGLILMVFDEDYWYLGQFPRGKEKCPGTLCPIEKTVTKHKGTTIKHENINYKEIPVSSGINTKKLLLQHLSQVMFMLKLLRNTVFHANLKLHLNYQIIRGICLMEQLMLLKRHI